MNEILSSFREKAFLGEAIRSEKLINQIDQTAKKVNMILNPVDDIAKKKVVGESIKLIEDLTEQGQWKAGSVDKLLAAENDKNRPANRELASKRLDILGKGVFVAMRYGENEELKDVLGKASAVEIDNVLPEPLKGLGERVRSNIIEDENILKVLDDLDKTRRVTSGSGKTGEKKLEGKIDESLDKLLKLSEEGADEEEIKMVWSYLAAEKDMRGGGEREKNVIENVDKIGKPSLLDKIAEDIKRSADSSEVSAKQAASRYELEKDVREVSLGEQLDAYLYIKAPRERAPQQWEYDVPIDGMDRETWRRLLNFQDQWLAAIYNKRVDSAYNVSLEKMKDGILGMKTIEEGDLKFWYEDKTIKLKEVMHEISRELLTKEIVVSGNEERTIYAFATEPERDKDGEFKKDKNGQLTEKRQYLLGSHVKELVDNEANYKLALAKRLVKKNIIKNLNVAKLSVAMAMDVMEMGGVFSVADSLRKLSWESDALRLAQRPERKFSSKVGGGELFAGPWTELANTLGEGNPKKAMELIKTWKVVPDLLSGSFLDQKLYLANGEKTKKTMMEMIYNNEKIPFRDLGNDLYFLWRKDHVMPAARTWLYIANKVPLEFSKNRENDAVISQWRSDLFNDINQLRKNEDCILPTSVVAGAIGGSLGLWPFEGPYLRVSGASHDNAIIDYFESTTEIVRQLGLERDEYNKILQFFGVDNKNYNDLNRKIVSYTEIRNVTLPEWYKKKSRKTLFTKRPNR